MPIQENDGVSNGAPVWSLDDIESSEFAPAIDIMGKLSVWMRAWAGLGILQREDRFVAVLKKMATPVMPAAEAHRIPGN
jgi:hypothetical protein